MTQMTKEQKTILLKYAERLQKSSEEKESEEIQHRIEDAELQLKSDILATRRAISPARKKLENAKGRFPFDSAFILEQKSELKSLEEGLKELEELQKELF